MKQFLTNGSILSLDNDTFLVGYGAREWLPQPGTFFFPDFFLEKKHPWCTHEETVTLTKQELIDQLRELHKEVTPPFWTEAHSSPFYDAFTTVKEKKLEKVVPYVMTTTTDTMSNERLIHTLLHALTHTRDLYLYGCWGGQGGILGLTPEVLFELKGNQLTTAAIAGTATLGSDSNNMLSDEKLMQEHQIVIDGIQESLRLFGTVHIGETGLLTLETLCHLKTPITVELREALDVAQLVKALHPTPALGAYPKEKGMQWLESYNNRIPRNQYGAPVGYCQGNVVAAYVAIRNVQWTPNGMALAAGCGIIAESEPEKEWKEIQLKTESVYQTLGFKTCSLPKALSRVLSTVV